MSKTDWAEQKAAEFINDMNVKISKVEEMPTERDFKRLAQMFRDCIPTPATDADVVEKLLLEAYVQIVRLEPYAPVAPENVLGVAKTRMQIALHCAGYTHSPKPVNQMMLEALKPLLSAKALKAVEDHCEAAEAAGMDDEEDSLLAGALRLLIDREHKARAVIAAIAAGSEL